MINKAYKVRLYPTKPQKTLIDKTFGCTRFIYNQMLAERIEVYEKLKDNKEELYKYKYKTEKEYKQEFPWLSEPAFSSLQQSRINLEKAYLNFYSGLKKNKKVGFPKFKKKGKCTDSYRECQIGSSLRVENNKLKLSKLGFVKFRGLSKNFKGTIKSVTVSRTKSGNYYASILVEKEFEKRERNSDNIIGIDLGLKEFMVCSNGEIIKGIKVEITQFEQAIKKQQRHLSRKQRGSKRYEKCRIKLNQLYDKRGNFLNHFQWHLVNKLCSENQAISLENLNVAGMVKNRKLSHAIQNINWNSFLSKLEQKAKEYETEIYKVDRFFPSSKLCSKCGSIKEDLTLADRVYQCSCGNNLDRDLNASINIRNNYLINKKSSKYGDYKHGEIVNPKEIFYNSCGSFDEVLTKSEVYDILSL